MENTSDYSMFTQGQKGRMFGCCNQDIGLLVTVGEDTVLNVWQAVIASNPKRRMMVDDGR